MNYFKHFTAVLLLSTLSIGVAFSQILTGPTLEFTHPAMEASLGMDQFAGYADEAFISPGDINGDGHVDFVRGMRNNWGNNGIGFWINNGTSPNVSFTYSGDNPYGIVTPAGMIHTDLWDYDNDGDLDIFAVSPDVDGILLWINAGTSTAPAFSSPTTLYSELLDEAKSLTIADFNGDGQKDFIIGQFNSALGYHRVAVMLNTGSTGNPLFETVDANPNGIDISAVSATSLNVPNLTFFDWDNDGDLDIFGMSESDNQVFYVVNSGSATNPIYGVAEFQFSIWSWYNSNFEFLDINGDGILEALLGQSTGRVFVMYQVFSGCTDQSACNYDANAQIMDYSCVFPSTFYYDGDGDGLGTPNNTAYACAAPEGFVSNYDDCDDNNALLSGPPGDPSVWGEGVWNAYAFQGSNYDVYKGFYVREGSSYNTVSDFGWEGTPSEAVGYQGCFVTNELHSMKFKRQGFADSEFPYSITIPSWDDDVQVYVDGALVWSTGCCNNNYMDNVVWTGTLTSTSTVEIDYMEYYGGSYLYFIVEPNYPLNISGSSSIGSNACYAFNYSAFVSQDFNEDPSTMTYTISSQNGLIDTANFDLNFYGSEVVFGLQPLEIVGGDALTIVVNDNMGYSDTLLVYINLGECPPPLEIWGTTETSNDACTSFDFYVGVNSGYGYSTDELTFVTTFEDTNYVQSTTPVYFDNWFDGAWIGFNANGVLGSTIATTVVTDPLGNSDTLVTTLYFTDCYPIMNVQNDWELTCGDSIGTFSVTYAFSTEGVGQSISYIESYNNSAAPIENLLFLSSNDTTLVENGITYYGTTYNYQFEFDYLGDWTEFHGYFEDDQNENYDFYAYFESIADYNPPNVYSDQQEVQIVLPAGVCDTTITWNVVQNPINAFGPGSTYLTNQHEGSFYAAINGGAGLSYIGVDGNSGADCDGDIIDGNFPVTTPNGASFNVFYSIMNNTGDPLTHQLWFVPVSEIEATTSIDYEICDHRFVIEGLTGTPKPYFYYLFSSLEYGVPYDMEVVQQVAQNIANGFGPYLTETFDLTGLSAQMGSVVSNINSTLLNDGNYYPIEIEDDFETDENNNPVGINDGGGDIYDGANFIITNFNNYYANDESGVGIPYTNGAVFEGGSSLSVAPFNLIVEEGCSFDIVSSIESGSVLSVGLTEIEFTVTDNSGNQSTHIVAVNVMASGEEICNELDDNCDGEIDEYVQTTFYADADGDGAGNIDEVVLACTLPQGYVDNSDDCDDALLTYADNDGDGFGSDVLDACGAVSNNDCDDANAEINAEATEICGNGVDEDCSGSDTECTIEGCTDESACNYDATANIEDGSCTYPTESFLTCDGLCIHDTDLDGVCDEIEVAGCTDAAACNYDAAATNDDGSCILPMEETCNGLDDNCDGEVDEFVLNTYFADADGDGFGNMEEVAYACSTPVGYVNNMEDCNDAAITYLDADNDGYGSMTIDACGVTSNDDCDDSNASVNTAGIEVCGNGIDEDCSGEDEACSILGCTDATACNYDAIATEDDGSCVMPVAEICNGLDDNCDGEVDEFVLNTYFADADGDGFGNMEEVAYACSTPVGYVNNMEDCNDAAITYLDADNDGYGSMTIDACGVEYNDDCDDSNDMVNASGIEVCGNGVDEDCSGSDEVCEIAGCTDMNACNYDANATLEDGTCTYPTESYLNCDGLCLNDGDADGVCDELEVTGCTDATACNYDAMATEDDGSCILPMDEVCNDVDDDCDGEVDEFVTTAYYFDGDADGFGNAQEVVFACSAPAGYVDNADDCDDAIMTFEDLDNDGFGSNNLTACGISNNTDCDDNNASINSGTAEVCNDIDDDCDGSIDNGLTFVGYYADADLDGYGAGNASSFCADPGVGYSTTNDDCDDMNAGINPGATEIEGNDVDENCDGEVLSVSTTSVMTFQLYPNPTRGMLYLEHNANSAVTVTVLDAQGKVVTKESLVQSKWTNDCSNWDAGVYFVRIQGDSFSKTASFIVE